MVSKGTLFVENIVLEHREGHRIVHIQFLVFFYFHPISTVETALRIQPIVHLVNEESFRFKEGVPGGKAIGPACFIRSEGRLKAPWRNGPQWPYVAEFTQCIPYQFPRTDYERAQDLDGK